MNLVWWDCVFKTKYFPHHSIWEATSNSTNVSIWKAILRARDEVQKKLFGSLVMRSLFLCGITTVHLWGPFDILFLVHYVHWENLKVCDIISRSSGDFMSSCNTIFLQILIIDVVLYHL